MSFCLDLPQVPPPPQREREGQLQGTDWDEKQRSSKPGLLTREKSWSPRLRTGPFTYPPRLGSLLFRGDTSLLLVGLGLLVLQGCCSWGVSP